MIDPDVAKRFLRATFAEIIRDFDRQGGAFSDLPYYSPWIVASNDWARRSGHSINELRAMITHQRIAECSKTELAPQIERIFEDFRLAVRHWKEEHNYDPLPVARTAEDGRFENARQIKRHIEEIWNELGFLQRGEAIHDAGDMNIGGHFIDKMGHRVYANLTIKMRYGGNIQFDLRFPYYDLSDPAFFDLFCLSGWRLCHHLELPFPPELEWIAGKCKTDFTAIDGVLGILRATLSYFRLNEMEIN